ncbi:type IV pili methyl-accepting chemotaxis transducer N-terminal domain-containing protein [uncultured Winogradskyella sp.]|uniref:sensor histidine kinase n=1 Tax=uncultured Winogradskyella sp. TaxID=395353 RepID=UPI002602B59B|nr:type IV pili methyl-accepting chemotaxis transducer N-terminal domain-containing protein [uncultured Winogradskyella sp.]|tara:strand:+ start:12821 stop:14635 length:1815 start_codon:yes stop_codon:yes gene_type:complete
MATNVSSLDNRTFNKLRRLYIIALSAIALSVFISQIFVRNYLDDQQSDSTVINVAGRQRMLSQRITKEVLLISTENNIRSKIALKNKLIQTLNLWETSHNGLQKGNDSINLPGENSEAILLMYKSINPYHQNILQATKSIIKTVETNPKAIGFPLTKNIDLIKKNEGPFLKLMDKIVNQYNTEANAKVDRLRNLELILVIITLTILLGEFIFIFWPSAKFVKATIKRLLKSETQALKIARDADILREKNENSVKELRKLNEVMDRTLLFARVDANGSIIHIGDKFSRLFKVSHFTKGLKLSETITIDKSEQKAIDNLLTHNSKIGWQGEVKGTKKNKESVWLEMYIIPFYSVNEKSEFIIISSDITTRKNAQLEVEKLTNERYEEKMNQQKIIASKIIENQEKEQNRIAKDIHDGIGQMLTGLKFNLESINPKDVNKTTVKVEYLKELASNIIQGVRTATFNLAPPELGDYGIIPALTKLTQELNKFTNKKIEFYNKTDFDQRLDSLVEINIYRITQEAINNAIKYAESSHIVVTLSHSATILSIIIDDNGIGFNTNNTKNSSKESGGMGMMFMKERISYINGRFFVASSPENGTRITLNIPLT